MSDFKETENGVFRKEDFGVLEEKDLYPVQKEKPHNSNKSDTIEIKNRITERQIETENLLKNTDQLEKKIELVEGSISRKRKRIEAHISSEKKYKELNKELQEQLEESQQQKKRRQLSSNGNTSAFFESMQTMIEKAIQSQCDSGKSASLKELEEIRNSLKKAESSIMLDISKHTFKTLETSISEAKTKNRVQHIEAKLQKGDLDKEKLQAYIKQHCQNRAFESKRLLQMKTKLEHETKEVELKLSRRTKEVCEDPTIQSALKKLLRLKGACQQVKVEVESTQEQLENSKRLMKDQKKDDLVKKISELKDSIAEKSMRSRSMIRTNANKKL